MNFLVAPQRIGHGGAIACERRRIEHDEIEPWNNFFVWTRGGLRFEPVEDVRGFKGALVRQSVARGMLRGCGDSLGALIDAMHMRRGRARGVQGNAANKRETVEH